MLKLQVLKGKYFCEVKIPLIPMFNCRGAEAAAAEPQTAVTYTVLDNNANHL